MLGLVHNLEPTLLMRVLREWVAQMGSKFEEKREVDRNAHGHLRFLDLAPTTSSISFQSFKLKLLIDPLLCSQETPFVHVNFHLQFRIHLKLSSQGALRYL